MIQLTNFWTNLVKNGEKNLDDVPDKIKSSVVNELIKLGIITDENIQLAADKARKGKSKFPAVIHFNEHEEVRLAELKTLLTSKQYRVSPYTTHTTFSKGIIFNTC